MMLGQITAVAILLLGPVFPLATPGAVGSGTTARTISSGFGDPVGSRQGGGEADEQQIEGAVEFGGAVVGGQGGRQRTHLGELGDR